MSSESEVIEATVGKAAEELAKRVLGRDDRVTITIEPISGSTYISSG